MLLRRAPHIMSTFIAVLPHEDCQMSHHHITDMKNKIAEMSNHDSDFYKVYAYKNAIIGFQGTEQDVWTFDHDRYQVMFNGKIYNTSELRHELKSLGYHFETNLTSEVIANLFLAKGIHAFRQLRGMFAILIWDHLTETLYGARDHFGMKPLYYSERREETVVSTDKKSLLLSEHTDEQMNNEAIQHYFSFQYMPQTMTINKNVYKMEPGTYFVKTHQQPMQKHQYFHAQFTPIITDKQHMMSNIRDSLLNSVATHVNTDQFLGAFLSGGIDSSLIAAIAKEHVPDLKTFSVGFSVDGFSELDEAKQTASFLGLENTAYMITPEAFINELPKIMQHLDDPFANPSCIPLYFAAREAKKHVNTVLSGEGADEFFAGYNLYREFKALRMFHYFPELINHALSRFATMLPKGFKGKSFIERGTTTLNNRYIGHSKIFEDDEKQHILKRFNHNTTYQSVTNHLFKQVVNEHPTHQMQYIDLHTWLPCDNLVKATTMTEAHGLELRLPFLDKEMFNVAKTIPVKDKIAKGTTKSILREAFKGFLPDDVLNRNKLGFPVPVVHWLKNELFDWAKQLINMSDTDHLINKQYVRYLLDCHATSKGRYYGRRIWTVLMFMLWHQVHIEEIKPQGVQAE